jgi:hypothetical protein
MRVRTSYRSGDCHSFFLVTASGFLLCVAEHAIAEGEADKDEASFQFPSHS